MVSSIHDVGAQLGGIVHQEFVSFERNLSSRHGPYWALLAAMPNVTVNHTLCPHCLTSEVSFRRIRGETRDTVGLLNSAHAGQDRCQIISVMQRVDIPLRHGKGVIICDDIDNVQGCVVSMAHFCLTENLKLRHISN